MTQPAAAITALPDDKTLQELEEKFDPEMRFRPSVPPATQVSAMSAWTATAGQGRRGREGRGGSEPGARQVAGCGASSRA